MQREVAEIVDQLVRRFEAEETLVTRAPAKKTSKSAQAATKGAALAKNLPGEIKAEIGKQGLDGTRKAADRAKLMGTSDADIRKGYQSKINKEIKNGDIKKASWGLQATLDDNRKLRRGVEDILDLLTRDFDDELLTREFDDEELYARGFDDDESLVARGRNKKTSKSAQAATKGAALAKNLPGEIKAEIGKQGLDGTRKAADRAKLLGTSDADIRKSYQTGINKEIKGGDIKKAGWGLNAMLDENRKLRRSVEDIVDLLTRDFDDELFSRGFDDEELYAREFEDESLSARAPGKKTSKSAQAATKGAALAKNLPGEIKAEIGKQGLDGTRKAADRAKLMGTSDADIRKGYQSKINKEIKSGDIKKASWGLQATLDENRAL